MSYRGELLERCAGYYDGIHGVLFVDVTTKEQHFAIDFHEGTHRWLAEHSLIGDLYRFFSKVEERAEEDFPADALAEIRSLRELITETTYLPQEVTATYLSLHACHRFHSDEFDAVLEALPQSYYDLYELGLSAFGALASGENDDENNRHAEIVAYIGAAAMSPPADAVPTEIDLNDLSNLRAFLETHSGNRRYREILEHAVAPYGEPGMITDGVRLDMSNARRFVEATIEAACPGIRIEREHGMAKWAESFFAALKQAVATAGSSAFAETVLQHAGPEDWGGDNYTQELSTLAANGERVPFYDTAITLLGHQPVGDGLVDYLIDMAASNDVIVHAHLVPVVPDTDLADPNLPDGGCILFAQVLIPDESPLLYAAPLDQSRVHQLLDEMPRNSLVVRARSDLYSSLEPLIADHLHSRRIYLCIPDNGADRLSEFVTAQPRSYVFFSTVGDPGVPDLLIQVLMDEPKVLIGATTSVRWAFIAQRIAEAGHHVILDGTHSPETSGVDIEELRQVVNVICLGLLNVET